MKSWNKWALNVSDKRPIKIVLPDAGPLISLAKSGHLDLLLLFKPQVQIIVSDAVYHETTRHPEKHPDAAEIKRFLTVHADRIQIHETEYGRNFIMSIRARDAYEAASEEVRRIIDQAGATPVAVAHHVGDMAILSMTQEITSEHPDDAVLVLSEDRTFLNKVFAIGKHAHILSTRGFLEGLAHRKIISFEAVWTDIVNARPGMNPEIVDRSAQDVPTEWESAIDDAGMGPG